ncbi:MAG: hypothetical protein IPM39_27390 [Chloroflexi bacterium]|nr:hypothetical protein [Chloroflexota bacterium]
MRNNLLLGILAVVALLIIGTVDKTGALITEAVQPLADNPAPPASPVKLVFIHHSTGENWLTDGYGDLGLALAQNNYFVSDTNYGWGPDSIGDRTDIPNWPEWFRSAATPRYMAALLSESEQHANYTRTFADPGGENQIVLFKSCFPNSDLYGSPDDAPTPGYDFTVGNAKWVYNEILQYFATRPDKLFVVITAPPLSAPSIPENARAFNQWLVNDWLRENDYPYNNVAVFDFYNILTDPDAHHQVVSGTIEHAAGSQDTLYYPSDDDHPSVEGSRKATAEFVPMLNVFYHRWQSEAASPLPTVEPVVEVEAETEMAVTEEEVVETAVLPATLLDNFETNQGWEAFWDETTLTRFACAPAADPAGSGKVMQIEFDVAANSWATCAHFFDAAPAWQSAAGLSFRLQAASAGLLVNIDLYAGPEEARETYAYVLETPPDSVDNWIPVHLRWADFHRVDWEENAGAPFTDADRVSGLAFGFSTHPDTTSNGVIWVDDLSLGVDEAAAAMPAATMPTAEVEETGGGETAVSDAAPTKGPATPSVNAAGPCSASMIVLGMVGAPLAYHVRKRLPQQQRTS